MIGDKRKVLYPATVYRPTAVAILMEDSNILENRTKVVEFPNYSLDMKVIKENIKEPVVNPFGSIEVSHAVLLELVGDNTIVKHTLGWVDNISGEALLDQTFELDNLQASFVSASRFIALRVDSTKDMRVAGVYLVLNNDVHAWANGILASSPVNLIKYSQGINFEEPYKRLSTDDVRLGVKRDFVDSFEKLAAIEVDLNLTEEQKTEQKNNIIRNMEGDIIHFTDKGQYVVYTFGIPITHKQSSLCTYSLSYFTDGSIEPGTIDTDYWYGNKEVSYPDYSRNIARPFWVGRNEFLTMLGYTPSVLQLTDFHTFYWKFVQDRNLGKVFVPSLDEEWDVFRTGGAALGLNDYQMASIYLAYYLGVPTNIFPSAAGLFTNNNIDVFVKYVGRCHLFTFEWIDFNDVESDPGVGGFSFDYPYDADFLNFLNIEESAFSLTGLPASLCSAFKPHGWRFVAYPDPFNVIKPENDSPPQDPMYSGYTLRDVKGRTNLGAYAMCEIIIHEIGHAVDAYGVNAYKKKLTNMQEWLDIAGWTTDQSYDTTTAKIPKVGYSNTTADGHEVPVSGYGCTNAQDDFAETYRVYIINPAFLRDNFPRRFAFMEKYVKNLKPVEGGEHCALRDFCTKRKLWVCR